MNTEAEIRAAELRTGTWVQYFNSLDLIEDWPACYGAWKGSIPSTHEPANRSFSAEIITDQLTGLPIRLRTAGAIRPVGVGDHTKGTPT